MTPAVGCCTCGCGSPLTPPDIELAKQLSLREPSPQAAESCQPHLQEDLVFLKSASSLLGSRGKAEPRLFRPPTLQPIGLQLAAPLPLPPTSYSPSPPPSLSPSLPPAANHGSSVDVDVDASNGTGMGLDLGLPHSPVTNGDPASGSEWDEEELATALSLSLMDVPALSPA